MSKENLKDYFKGADPKLRAALKMAEATNSIFELVELLEDVKALSEDERNKILLSITPIVETTLSVCD